MAGHPSGGAAGSSVRAGPAGGLGHTFLLRVHGAPASVLAGLGVPWTSARTPRGQPVAAGGDGAQGPWGEADREPPPLAQLFGKTRYLSFHTPPETATRMRGNLPGPGCSTPHAPARPGRASSKRKAGPRVPLSAGCSFLCLF